MFSPIFIVGCPRSGTTLLRNLLRSHRRLTFPGESHFVPLFFRAYGDPRNEREALKLARRILRLRWVREWELHVAPEEFAGCRSYRELICSLYGVWARAEGKPRWGDKTPHYVMWIPELRELFPEAKFLHIVRDGRDVALSWLERRFEPRNLYTAAVKWKSYVTTGRREGAALPAGAYLEVRYEALLSSPGETMREVCSFLDEPFDEAVLTPSAPAYQLRPPEQRKREISHISIDTLVRANTGKWKTRMPPPDRMLFESLAGDLLEALGYETEGRQREVSAAERWRFEIGHGMLRAVDLLLAAGDREFALTSARMEWARLLSRIRPRFPSH